MFDVMLEKEYIILFLPIWLIITIMRLIIDKKKGEKILIKKELFINLFYIYIICLASLTILDFNRMDFTVKPTANILPVVNTINDLKYIENSSLGSVIFKFWIRNLIGNGMLLLPIAIFLPLLWERFRNIKATVLTCFFISLFIECFQYISAYWGCMRSCDIDDIILNTLSAFIGYFIYDKVLRRIKFFNISCLREDL